jgi:hypothetical protein
MERQSVASNVIHPRHNHAAQAHRDAVSAAIYAAIAREKEAKRRKK